MADNSLADILILAILCLAGIGSAAYVVLRRLQRVEERALGDVELQRQVKEMLKRQQRGQWGAQHKALRELREGLYADIADEAEKLFGADPREANKRSGSRLGKVKALLSKSPSPPRSGSKKG